MKQHESPPLNANGYCLGHPEIQLKAQCNRNFCQINCEFRKNYRKLLLPANANGTPSDANFKISIFSLKASVSNKMFVD